MPQVPVPPCAFVAFAYGWKFMPQVPVPPCAFVAFAYGWKFMPQVPVPPCGPCSPGEKHIQKRCSREIESLEKTTTKEHIPYSQANGVNVHDTKMGTEHLLLAVWLIF